MLPEDGRRIPVCEPYFGGREREYVLEAVDTKWVSSAGEFLESFEARFAAYCGRLHGIATTSGTTALHLAVAAAGIGPGDEVILPSFTIGACAFAVLYQGARPVLVDVDPDTYTMLPDRIEAMISPRTRAIMPVHIYGHPCDMDPILEIARRHDVLVIEDAAEAHGAEYRGRKCGSLGQLSCFSFYANKLITTGEGGMVLTDDEHLADRCRLLRNLAFNRERRFLHDEVGFNYRMTNLQAALGLAQLERLDEYVERRRRNADLYNEQLGEVEGLHTPTEREWAKNVYWMYGIVVDGAAPATRDRLMSELATFGIETRCFFLPLHEQAVFRRDDLQQHPDSLPTASYIGARGLYLPSSTGLTEEEIRYVASAVIDRLTPDDR